MKKTIIIACTAGALSFPLTANAETKASDKGLEKFLSFKKTPGLEFVANKDDKTGKATIAYARNTHVFDVSVSGKLNSNNNTSGSFLDLEGLKADANLTLGYNRLLIRDASISRTLIDEEVDEQINRINLAKAARTRCKDAAKAEDQSADEIKETCKSEILALADALKMVSAETHSQNPLKSFWFWNSSISYGNNNFKWYDVSQEKSQKSSEETYGLTIGLGKIMSESHSRLDIELKYQKGYEKGSDNRERELCKPLADNSTFTECFKGLLLPPLEKETMIPSVSFSKIFDNDSILKALNIKLAYVKEKAELREDGSVAEADRWGVSMPLHVYISDDKKYSAGMQLDWSSKNAEDQDPLTISFFFKSALSVLK